MKPAPRLLLLSSSRIPNDDRYLTWASSHFRSFLGDVRSIAFVPFAGVRISYEEYTNRVAAAFKEVGVEVKSVHEVPDPATFIRSAEAIAVGGGNTFQLVAKLHQTGLMGVIAERVNAGVPFIGWSAGSNVACPTLRTTNDMPIIQPPSFTTLNLVPFQINPHYTDFHPPNHRGETRADRLREFLELNRQEKVVAIREGSILRREGDKLSLLGDLDALLFQFGHEPRPLKPGEDLSFLLQQETL